MHGNTKPFRILYNVQQIETPATAERKLMTKRANNHKHFCQGLGFITHMFWVGLNFTFTTVVGNRTVP